jgi:hypothetical protein
MSNSPDADDDGCGGYAFWIYWFSLPVTCLLILQKNQFPVMDIPLSFSILVEADKSKVRLSAIN